MGPGEDGREGRGPQQNKMPGGEKCEPSSANNVPWQQVEYTEFYLWRRNVILGSLTAVRPNTYSVQRADGLVLFLLLLQQYAWKVCPPAAAIHNLMRRPTDRASGWPRVEKESSD